MRILLVLAIFYSIFSFGSANVEQPNKEGKGFGNVNERKEYNYHQSPNENIWHEFGRPFWKAKKKTVKIEKPVLEVAPIQEVAEVNNDSDVDGVWDRVDQCPETAAGAVVNTLGCEVKANRNLSLDVKFNSGKSDIIRTYTSAIDRLGMALQENQDLKIEIQGHTDITGKTSFNNKLSNDRSAAVKEYLIEKYGISGDRLNARGFGAAAPVATNTTTQGRKLNRRVDIKILD